MWSTYRVIGVTSERKPFVYTSTGSGLSWWSGPHIVHTNIYIFISVSEPRAHCLVGHIVLKSLKSMLIACPVNAVKRRPGFRWSRRGIVVSTASTYQASRLLVILLISKRHNVWSEGIRILLDGCIVEIYLSQHNNDWYVLKKRKNKN